MRHRVVVFLVCFYDLTVKQQVEYSWQLKIIFPFSNSGKYVIAG